MEIRTWRGGEKSNDNHKSIGRRLVGRVRLLDDCGLFLISLWCFIIFGDVLYLDVGIKLTDPSLSLTDPSLAALDCNALSGIGKNYLPK